jgi:hypothetical protein
MTAKKITYRLISFSILLFIFAGCGGKTGADSPANAVKDFISAVKERNFNKAWSLLNEKSARYYDNSAKVRNISGREYFEKSLLNPNSLGLLNQDFVIVDQKQNGDDAIVIIKTKDEKVVELYTVKSDDAWKFDYIASIQGSIKTDNETQE